MSEGFTPVFACVNCEGPIPWSRKKKIYCGHFCKEQAKDIRWIRSTIIRGVYNDPDIALARITRIAHLNSGGYLALGRRIPFETRIAVMRKYDEKCAECGEPDNGTHEVDHISGSSNAIENLQLLCVPCHRAKTMENIVTVQEDDPRRVEIEIHAQELKARVFSPVALNPCDDSENWSELQKQIQLERKMQYFQHLLDNFLLPLLEEKLYPTHIANRMNEMGIPTISGTGLWSRKNVKPMLEQLGIERKYDPAEQAIEYSFSDSS